jgi:hypothetical protein
MLAGAAESGAVELAGLEAADAGVAVGVACEVLCAITGRDRARTTRAPRTGTNSFVDFIRLSFVTLVREYGTATITT